MPFSIYTLTKQDVAAIEDVLADIAIAEELPGEQYAGRIHPGDEFHTYDDDDDATETIHILLDGDDEYQFVGTLSGENRTWTATLL